MVSRSSLTPSPLGAREFELGLPGVEDDNFHPGVAVRFLPGRFVRGSVGGQQLCTLFYVRRPPGTLASGIRGLGGRLQVGVHRLVVEYHGGAGAHRVGLRKELVVAFAPGEWSVVRPLILLGLRAGPSTPGLYLTEAGGGKVVGALPRRGSDLQGAVRRGRSGSGCTRCDGRDQRLKVAQGMPACAGAG